MPLSRALNKPQIDIWCYNSFGELIIGLLSVLKEEKRDREEGEGKRSLPGNGSTTTVCIHVMEESLVFGAGEKQEVSRNVGRGS